MIRTETLTIGGKQFVRTYSDANRYVAGGSPVGEYTEAIDPAELGRTYTEGDIIPTDEQPAPGTPAWDVWQGRHFDIGDVCRVDERTFRAIVEHDATWSRRPLTGNNWKDFWEEVAE